MRYRKYFNDDKNSGGVKNVRTAALQEIQLLNDNGNRCEYIVSIDYTVSKEDEFYYNGVNYRYLILKKLIMNGRLLNIKMLRLKTIFLMVRRRRIWILIQ